MFPCVKLTRCGCGGKLKRTYAIEYVEDTGGDRIRISRCPMADLTPAHLELINEACIFMDTGIPPVAGGQEDQPMGFFETLSAVKSYQQQQQKLSEKRDAKT